MSSDNKWYCNLTSVTQSDTYETQVPRNVQYAKGTSVFVLTAYAFCLHLL